MDWIIPGVAGVAACVAAPFVIPAAVTAVGFGTSGIVAGTVAAKAMALGAGTTPAVVAVCQSIGATGAISMSTAAATGAATAIVVKAKQKE